MVGVERPPRVLPADHGGGGVIIEPVKLPPHGIEHLRQVAAGLAGYSPKGWMQTDGIRLYMIDPHSKRKMRQLYGGLVEMQLTEVFNGHNPRPTTNASQAIADVLSKGRLEVIEGAGTYLWQRWDGSG